LLSMIVVCLTASVSQATIFQFDAYLDGPQETPPNGSPGTGYGSLFLDDTTGNWSVTNGVFWISRHPPTTPTSTVRRRRDRDLRA